ncbi:MAG: DUF63 family protein [Candidatus Aenigmatarchaeota archaeon]
MKSLFEKYFIDPIIHREGYNIINTFVYSLIFVFFAAITFEFLKKLKIKVDWKLAFSITPFVLSSVIIRVLKDAEIVFGYIFVTPNIWFIAFIFIMLNLFISVFIEKKFKIPYYKIMFISGYIIFSSLLGLIQINNLIALFYVLPFLLFLSLLLFFIKNSIENKIVLGLQTFDSIITAVSIQWFGYEEQHVLPRLIIQVSGTPFSFIIVKFFVIYFSLKIIDKYEDKEIGRFLKLLIAILGLSTGMRDFLRLIWGV